jgi:N-acetylglucosaminyldiphosphoundecaprenol N-acetyl-beta-D-mannosaminyltransferase
VDGMPTDSGPVASAALLGVRVDSVDVPELHRRIARTIDAGERSLVLNVNVNCLNLAWDRPWLRKLLNDADVVFADGAGVQLGLRLLGHPAPPRITYNTWMWQLAPFAAEHGYSLFLLGARPGVAEKAAERLMAAHPALRIAGTQHGYFDRAAGSAENAAVIEAVNASGAQILLLGMGMPMQEEWLAASWPLLRANIALTGGAALDYVAGELELPPRLLAEHGFEWLGRLIIEPRRLWRRYLLGNPLFLTRVARQRLGRAVERAS